MESWPSYPAHVYRHRPLPQPPQTKYSIRWNPGRHIRPMSTDTDHCHNPHRPSTALDGILTSYPPHVYRHRPLPQPPQTKYSIRWNPGRHIHPMSTDTDHCHNPHRPSTALDGILTSYPPHVYRHRPLPQSPQTKYSIRWNPGVISAPCLQTPTTATTPTDQVQH